ncbi:hypothetical protein CF8_3208 [Nocardioides sp. CF8]|uniref:DUF4082 domain-containing protein n=1 Tax=Nocardioides sp. CF8 TaxID=110319 RepID=UPI00032E6A20|nr:DUF4082 domain-containing protein [Nocardioides sp. CF8]EON22846.1 hypothetical protein CF8_3208 [Nocardioides sp. CF8]
MSPLATHRKVLRPHLLKVLVGALAFSVVAGLPLVLGGAGSLAPVSATSNYGIWSDSVEPPVPAVDDPSSVTLGVEFASDTGGVVNAIQYYGTAANSGQHLGQLWGPRGGLLASVKFTHTTTRGWRTARFTKPVKIRPGVRYIASYRAPNGRHAIDRDSLGGGRTVSTKDLTAFRGTYLAGTGRPTRTVNESNYFVDVVFRPRKATTKTSTPTPAPTATTSPTATSTPTPTTTSSPTAPSSPTATTSPTATATPSQPQTSTAQCVRPDAGNTGHTGTLAAYNGPTWVSTPGAVIENVMINGPLVINADNVTVRNVHATGSVGTYADNTRIADSTIPHIWSSSGSGMLVERTDLGGGFEGDTFHVTSDNGSYIQGFTMRGNWIHDVTVPQGAHYDGIQVRGATGVLIECNNFDLGAYQEGYNAPVFFENDNGGYANSRVVDNWLLGGAFNIMLGDANDDGVVLTDNRVGGAFRWGLCMAEAADAKPAVQTGNTYLNGDPVVPCP